MRTLERIWWRRRESRRRRALLSPLLLGEALFRMGVGIRGALHRAGILRAARAGLPVISVGGLVVGGSGKTPAVLAIAARLAAAGRTAAVLSRGYGARRSDARVVSDGKSVLLGAAEGGDEPVLLARRLGVPVLCGPRRALLAPRAAAMGADVLLLDDGFQHRGLARDLDVVVLDAANPMGNGHCLPRGPAREPLSALRRAGLVWLSRVDQADGAELDRLRELARRHTGRAPVESRHAPTEVLDGPMAHALGTGSLAGRRVLLVSGVARPEGFRRTVEALGASVVAERAYADHHPFTDLELAEALATADVEGCEAVVMTEKDAVRLSAEQARHDKLRVLRIEAEVVAGEESLREALAGVLGRAGRGGTSSPTSTVADAFLRTLARSRRLARTAGALVAWLAWALRIRRRTVMENLALAFPERSEAERRGIARATYRHLGRAAPEFLLAPALGREELDRLFVYQGWERFEEARARGRGVIACTGHLGNFELLAAAHNLKGVPITMITRRMGRMGANDAWRRARARAGVEELVVRKGETLKAAVRALRQGRVLGYVIDQNQPRHRAVFPTFFGVPAATSPAPAILALRTGAAVIFIAAIALADGRHRVVIEGPLTVPRSGDRERDVLAFMQDLNDRLERMVRAHPDQWYWLHRRWKTRPAQAGGSED